MFRNEHQWNLIYFVAEQVIELSFLVLFSSKEVDFARSLFDKQHDFNGT